MRPSRRQVLQRAGCLRLLLYPSDVLLRHGVPCAHVFLHACFEACFFAFGESAAGFGNAVFETVFIQLFDEHACIGHGALLLDLAHYLGFPAGVSMIELANKENTVLRIRRRARHSG